MMIDVARARRETPGCDEVLHFNNAGAALMPESVLTVMRTYLELEAGMGGYEAADAANDRIERVYDSAAALLNCHRDEVAVVENATRAWDMAFYSVRLERGDRVLTSAAEYASNYIAYLQVAKRTGAVIEVIGNDEHGAVSPAALEKVLDDRVKLISITHVPTNGGLVNPAAEVGRIARRAGVPFLLDACQSVGQMPIDVEEIGCDLLSATSRKYLRGPRGMGLLYARRGLDLEPPFLDLHAAEWIAPGEYRVRADARRFENWEANMVAKVGMGEAIDYALQWGLEGIRHWVQTLAGILRGQLAEIEGVTVRDLGSERCGIVTFDVRGVASRDVFTQLAEQKMNVSVSTPASTRIDMERRGLGDLVRASVHYYNTQSEVDRFCGAIAGIAAG